jgi:hypothetical protein
MKYYKKNAALLQSDLWIICDGPVHQSGKQIYFVLETQISTSLFMLQKTLHSGHYGNWAPNPANASAIISFNER